MCKVGFIFQGVSSELRVFVRVFDHPVSEIVGKGNVFAQLDGLFDMIFFINLFLRVNNLTIRIVLVRKRINCSFHGEKCVWKCILE